MIRGIATIFGNRFAIFGQVLRSQALQSLGKIHIIKSMGYPFLTQTA